MSKKNIPVGFDRLYYAVMTDETTETYGVPKRLSGAISLAISPNVETANLDADDIRYATVNNLSDYEVELGIAELPIEDHAAILGHTIDSSGGLIEKTTDTAPYIALLYRRRLFNKKFKYVVLHKIKFAPSEEDIQTKGESIEFQTPTLTGLAIPRETDELARFSITEGDVGVSPSFISTFFDSVYVPGADLTPPTVTVVPLDAATGVAVAANVVWTFSKAIQGGLVNGSNFMLLDENLAPVAGSLTINENGDTVTFNPTTNLASGDTYTAFVTTNVKDLSGNALAAPLATTFTTA